MARAYRTIRMSGDGDYIASVSGSTGDYDLTLDSGLVIEGYDETAGEFDTTAPVAGDLCLFGVLTDHVTVSAANCQCIDADEAALYWKPVDGTL